MCGVSCGWPISPPMSCWRSPRVGIRRRSSCSDCCGRSRWHGPNSVRHSASPNKDDHKMIERPPPTHQDLPEVGDLPLELVLRRELLAAVLLVEVFDELLALLGLRACVVLRVRRGLLRLFELGG